MNAAADRYHSKRTQTFGRRKADVERDEARTKANADAARREREVGKGQGLMPGAAMMTSEAELRAFANAQLYFNLPGQKYVPPPPRPRRPALSEIEGKDIEIDVQTMPGKPRVEASWMSGWQGAGWKLTIRLPIVHTQTGDPTELFGDSFLGVDQLLFDMQHNGWNAHQAIGEAVRKNLALLYMHELDEALKVRAGVELLRVRNPHPRGAFSGPFSFGEYPTALDD